MKRILIVDDEKKIRDVISSYLHKEGYVTVEADSGNEALKVLKATPIDFLILDLMLPDRSGEEVCRTIRQEHSLPILMLTAKVKEDDKIQGLSIGADDYMVKPFSPRELIMRVKTILRRANDDQLLAERISYNDGNLTIDQANHTVRFQGENLSLTPNEFKLLVVLAKHPGRIYTRNELIEKVLGFDFEGDTRTIDQHVKNLRYKIERNPKEPAYITTIYGIGYKFTGGRT
ncbi:response regulator transcription factor [Alkalihalobacillus sp. TS-13]|uniref:response regulator transcription factor n=1 Tax=Alkalihalobacillus sp. TS-13 TaxID=2842455 RepID=UPI001C86B697|nr:response regulator transcription factor [Alkalihalobacillus sp. TS-13]